MAYSCDLAVMDYHGLSWMTFMDDCHGPGGAMFEILGLFYNLILDLLTDLEHSPEVGPAKIVF